MRTLCTLLTTVALLTPAFAAEEAPKPAKEKPAAPMSLKAILATADADKDGALTAAEIVTVTNEEAKARLMTFDVDTDGALSVSEIETAKAGWRPAKEAKKAKDGKEAKEAKEAKHKEPAEPAPAP